VSFNETGGTPNKTLDYNSYHADVSLKFKEGSTEYTTLAAWKTQTTQDAHSIDTDPLLNSSYKLRSGSPCIDAGTTIAGITAFYGAAPDMGWVESGGGSGGGGWLRLGLKLNIGGSGSGGMKDVYPCKYLVDSNGDYLVDDNGDYLIDCTITASAVTIGGANVTIDGANVQIND